MLRPFRELLRIPFILAEIAGYLATLNDRVESLDSEVKLMRQGVDRLGEEVDDLSNVMRPIRRARARRASLRGGGAETGELQGRSGPRAVQASDEA